MNLLELGISLLISIFVYLLFPLIFVKVNGKVDVKEGKKIALINSIVCASLFIVIRGVIFGWHTAVTSFAPAVLYYFIAKCILIGQSLSKNIVKKPEEEDLIELSESNTEVVSNENNELIMGSQNNIDIKNDVEKVFENSSSLKEIKKSVKCWCYISLVILIIVVLFSIIFPLSINSIYQSIKPDINDARITTLSDMNANAPTFHILEEDINYIFQRKENGFMVYKFYNADRYSSNGNERIGYATSSQLMYYFGNSLYEGQPNMINTMTFFIPVLVSVLIFLIIIIVFACIKIKLVSKEITQILIKKSNTASDLYKKYENGEISKKSYKNKQQKIISESILNDSKIFKIFRFLY